MVLGGSFSVTGVDLIKLKMSANTFITSLIIKSFLVEMDKH